MPVVVGRESASREGAESAFDECFIVVENGFIRLRGGYDSLHATTLPGSHALRTIRRRSHGSHFSWITAPGPDRRRQQGPIREMLRGQDEAKEATFDVWQERHSLVHVLRPKPWPLRAGQRIASQHLTTPRSSMAHEITGDASVPSMGTRVLDESSRTARRLARVGVGSSGRGPAVSDAFLFRGCGE